MSLPEFFEQFITSIKNTTLLEFIAVITGIASVWFSKKENILVYPIGLVNTTIYVYLSTKAHLYGEASVNIYYTIMSIYGWILWMKKDQSDKHILMIRHSTLKEWIMHLLFFAVFYVIIYVALKQLQKDFAPGAIPWADAFASATAFTGMWLMARKKVESWIWWILTNIASIPLYFVKGYVFTSVYYLVLLIIAFAGFAEWNKRATKNTLMHA